LTQEFNQSRRGFVDSQNSDLAWSRSDALNRMLADLYEISASEPVVQSTSFANTDQDTLDARAENQNYGVSSRIQSSTITGVYVISVAARLADMHPQTLRKYDKEGLVSPQRSQGSRRLYSDSDVERLRVIRRLADELGLNLNGVSLVLDLVRSLTDIVLLLETNLEVADKRAAKVASDEIRQILGYVGADWPYV